MPLPSTPGGSYYQPPTPPQPAMPAVPVLPVQPVTPIIAKPGYKSTEFWGKSILQVISLLTIVGGFLPGKYGIAASVALEVAYAISRGLTKLGAPTVEVTPS